MVTLLVSLMIGGSTPHPGPTDDKIANGKRDSTESSSSKTDRNLEDHRWCCIIKLLSYKSKEKYWSEPRNLASTNKDISAAADDTLVGMAVKWTHLARARSADSGHASWGQRSEVRQQYTPVSKRRAGVGDHGTAGAGGAHPQRMDTDRSAWRVGQRLRSHGAADIPVKASSLRTQVTALNGVRKKSRIMLVTSQLPTVTVLVRTALGMMR